VTRSAKTGVRLRQVERRGAARSGIKPSGCDIDPSTTLARPRSCNARPDEAIVRLILAGTVVRAARQEGHVDFASRGAGRAGRWPEGAAGGQEYERRTRGSLASAPLARVSRPLFRHQRRRVESHGLSHTNSAAARSSAVLNEPRRRLPEIPISFVIRGGTIPAQSSMFAALS